MGAINIKRKIAPLILAFSLVMLSVIYPILNHIFDEEGDSHHNYDHDHDHEETFIVSTELDAALVVKIALTRGSETQTYILDDRVWKYENGEVLGETYPKTALGALGEITLYHKISSDGAESPIYGFDSPTLAVTATYADGTEFVFRIGRSNYLNGEFYFSCTVSDEVYMIESKFLEYFDFPENPAK